MNILGVDPGLRITGYGMVAHSSAGLRLVEAGEIKTKPAQPLEKRLSDLYTGFESVVSEFLPDAVVVEELYAHYKHPRTAVIMGHARGVFFLVAGMHDIPIYSYSATKIKNSLTGTGHATKAQVAGMVERCLGCAGMDGHADVTDAIAAALCHINTMTHTGMT